MLHSHICLRKILFDSWLILALYEHGNFKIKVGIKLMSKKYSFKSPYHTTLFIHAFFSHFLGCNAIALLYFCASLLVARNHSIFDVRIEPANKMNDAS